MNLRLLLIEKANGKTFTIDDIKPVNVDKVKDIWHKGLPEEENVKGLVAVDGSRNKKAFIGYVLYATAAVSASFVDGKEENLYYSGDVDLLKPDEYSDTRLRMLMGILEAKRALRSLRDLNPDVLLLDGSIIGNIIRPFPYPIDETLARGVERIFDELKAEFSLDRVNAKDFYDEMTKEFGRKDLALAAAYLEYLEYLYIHWLLLDESDGRLIALAKTSQTRVYGFNCVVSDMSVFYLSNIPEGYSKPVDESIEGKKFGFPSSFEAEFKDRSMKVCFVRFSDSSNVYKVETSMDMEGALGVLKSSCVLNYPYPLKLVHENVKIDNKLMQSIVDTTHIKGFTGREDLGS